MTRPAARRLPPAPALLALAALALAVHVGIGLAIDGSALLPGDAAAFDAMDDLRFGAGLDAVRVLTDVGSFPVVLIVVAMTAAYVSQRQGRRRRALTLVAGFVLLFLLVHFAKDLWDRPRPEGRQSRVFGLSYPSGHAAYATSYVACALAIGGGRRLVAAAAAVTMAVAASRLYLHVHFLTDVVGGVALGIAVYAALLR